jgi:hypothetical protein
MTDIATKTATFGAMVAFLRLSAVLIAMHDLTAWGILTISSASIGWKPPSLVLSAPIPN